MKKIQRVLIGVISITIALINNCQFTIANAEAEKTTEIVMTEKQLMREGLLNSLGIIDASDKKEVTRAEFAKAVVSLLNYDIVECNEQIPFSDVLPEDEIYNNVALLYKYGVISACDKFRPEEKITENEAKKMAVSALGYEYEAEKNGGWPTGYGIAAANVGLDVFNGDNVLTRAEYVQMFYKMLNVEIRSLKIGTNKIEKDGKVLENYLHITTVEGKVEANSHTGLLNVLSKTDSPYVLIDGEYYIEPQNAQKNMKKLGDYLGYKVRLYVSDKLDSTQVIGYEILSDEIVVIDADKVEKVKNFKVVTEKNSYLLDKDYHIIYNGVSAGDCKESELDFNDGKFELLDSDNNGKYDLLYVWKDEYIVVGTFASDGSNVFDTDNHKYGSKNIVNICLNDTDVDYDFYKKDGTKTIKCKLDDLRKYPTLMVNISRNGEYIKVLGFSNQIKGAISGISEDSVTIDKVEYKLSDYSHFKKWCVDNKIADVYLSVDNKFLSASTKTDSMKYGYLMKVGKEDGIKNYSAYILKENGEKAIIDFDEKVYIDGQRYNTEDVITNNTLEPYQVIKYSEKAEKIARVDTAQEDRLFEKNLDEFNNLRLYYTGEMYWYDNDMLCPYLKISAPVVFNVPTILKTNKSSYEFNEDDFFVESLPKPAFEYKIDAWIYDADDEGGCKVILRYNDANPEVSLKELTTDSHVGVIDDVKIGITEDGSAVRQVTLVENNKFYTYYFSDLLERSYNSQKKEVHTGDVVRFETTGNFLTNLRVEFNYNDWCMDSELDSSLATEYRNHPEYGARSIVHYYIGKIYNYNNNTIVIRDEIDNSIRPIEWTNSIVMRYSKKDDIIRPINKNDLVAEYYTSLDAADKVVAITRYFKSTSLLIIYGD